MCGDSSPKSSNLRIPCKANEHAVRDALAYRNLLPRIGTVYLKARYTNVDPRIERFPRDATAKRVVFRRFSERGWSQHSTNRIRPCR